MVECQLPKLDVAGSNPVLRSSPCPSEQRRLVRSPSQVRHVGKIAEGLAIVEAVPHEEVVWYLKARIAHLHIHQS